MYTLETWNDLKFDYILESPRKNIMGFLIFYHGKPGIIMGFFSNKVLRTLIGDWDEFAGDFYQAIY